MSRSEYELRLLTVEQTVEVWDDIKPMLGKACLANDIAQQDLTAEQIYQRVHADDLCILAGYKNNKPAIVLVLQFILIGNRKGATIIAIAGSELVAFKNRYWEMIQEWMRTGLGLQFVEAYASERLATLYERRFGFDTSCRYVRKTL